MVLKRTMAVCCSLSLLFKKKQKDFFRTPLSPLSQEGFHFSLYPLLSEKGKIDYDGNPLRQGLGTTLKLSPLRGES